jgi:GNAT superfamily N-acetyltransferase
MYAKISILLQRHLGLSLYQVLSRPLDPAAGATAAGPVRFTLLSENELLPHCADPELELSARTVRAAFARGDLCAGALEGGRLLGYAWFAFGATPESAGAWVEFDARSRYTYKHFVRRACRGRRIAAGLLAAADALCVERGCNRCVTLIYTYNRASIRASERTGARTAGYVATLRLFGRLLCWRSPGARREGVRVFKPQSNFRPFSLAMRRLASMLAATTSRN